MTKGLMCVVLFASSAMAQLDQKTDKQNMVRDRGQTNVERRSAETQVTGVLFDAGCRDRSAWNLSAKPETIAGASPVQPAGSSAGQGSGTAAGRPQGSAQAKGVAVDARTLSAEQADVLAHRGKEMYTRQSDPTCAVTGGTSGYAVRLDDGRILNLDEGGNTLAAEFVYSTADGRAMLNGTAYGFKPRVTVSGSIRGDRMRVKQITGR